MANATNLRIRQFTNGSVYYGWTSLSSSSVVRYAGSGGRVIEIEFELASMASSVTLTACLADGQGAFYPTDERYKPSIQYAVSDNASDSRYISATAATAGEGRISVYPSGYRSYTFTITKNLYDYGSGHKWYLYIWDGGNPSSDPFTTVSLYFVTGSATVTNTAVSYAPLAGTASTVSVSGGVMGQAQNITITRNNNSFVHTLKWAFAGHSGTIASNVATAYSWTPDADVFGRYIPNAISNTLTITCETYYNGNLIGTPTTASLSLRIPTSGLAPTVLDGWASVWLDNTGTGAAGKSTYYTGISKVKASVDTSKISPKYGANLNYVSVTYKTNWQTSTSGTHDFGTIDAPSISVHVEVHDTRECLYIQDFPFTAVEYTAPSFSGVSVFRCKQSGEEQSGGAWFSITATVVGTGNELKLYYSIKPAGGSFGSATEIASGQTHFPLGGNLASNMSYLVRLAASDGLGAYVTLDITLPTDDVALNIMDGGHAAAFGRYAELSNTLDVEWNLKVRGDTTLEDLDAGSGDFDALSVNGVLVLTKLPYASGQTTINSTPTTLSDVYTLTLPAGLKLLTIMASYYSAIPQELALGNGTYIRAGQTAALSGKTAQYLQLTTLTEETSLHVYGKWAQSGSSVLSWKYITMPI